MCKSCDCTTLRHSVCSCCSFTMSQLFSKRRNVLDVFCLPCRQLPVIYVWERLVFVDRIGAAHILLMRTKPWNTMGTGKWSSCSVALIPRKGHSLKLSRSRPHSEYQSQKHLATIQTAECQSDWTGWIGKSQTDLWIKGTNERFKRQVCQVCFSF